MVRAPAITECSVCKEVVGYGYSKIAKKGCGFVTDAEGAAMCEAVGLGPEDPLADICVACVVTGCPIILKYAEKGIKSPTEICQDLGKCDSNRKAEASNEFASSSKDRLSLYMRPKEHSFTPRARSRAPQSLEEKIVNDANDVENTIRDEVSNFPLPEKQSEQDVDKVLSNIEVSTELKPLFSGDGEEFEKYIKQFPNDLKRQIKLAESSSNSSAGGFVGFQSKDQDDMELFLTAGAVQNNNGVFQLMYVAANATGTKVPKTETGAQTQKKAKFCKKYCTKPLPLRWPRIPIKFVCKKSCWNKVPRGFTPAETKSAGDALQYDAVTSLRSIIKVPKKLETKIKKGLLTTMEYLPASDEGLLDDSDGSKPDLKKEFPPKMVKDFFQKMVIKLNQDIHKEKNTTIERQLNAPGAIAKLDQTMTGVNYPNIQPAGTDIAIEMLENIIEIGDNHTRAEFRKVLEEAKDPSKPLVALTALSTNKHGRATCTVFVRVQNTDNTIGIYFLDATTDLKLAPKAVLVRQTTTNADGSIARTDEKIKHFPVDNSTQAAIEARVTMDYFEREAFKQMQDNMQETENEVLRQSLYNAGANQLRTFAQTVPPLSSQPKVKNMKPDNSSNKANKDAAKSTLKKTCETDMAVGGAIAGGVGTAVGGLLCLWPQICKAFATTHSNTFERAMNTCDAPPCLKHYSQNVTGLLVPNLKQSGIDPISGKKVNPLLIAAKLVVGPMLPTCGPNATTDCKRILAISKGTMYLLLTKSIKYNGVKTVVTGNSLNFGDSTSHTVQHFKLMVSPNKDDTVGIVVMHNSMYVEKAPQTQLWHREDSYLGGIYTNNEEYIKTMPAEWSPQDVAKLLQFGDAIANHYMFNDELHMCQNPVNGSTPCADYPKPEEELASKGSFLRSVFDYFLTLKWWK
eukprot:g112.t1